MRGSTGSSMCGTVMYKARCYSCEHCCKRTFGKHKVNWCEIRNKRVTPKMTGTLCNKFTIKDKKPKASKVKTGHLNSDGSITWE